MLLDVEPTVRFTNARLLYIHFIESAPWNLPTAAGDTRRFSGTGSLLLAVAFQLSIEAGCHGALALDAVQDAVAFYERFGFRVLYTKKDYAYMVFTTRDGGEP